jgi:hypothetical protein
VDVQSAKVQQVVSKDVLAAIPSGRNATTITALIPGMSTNTDSGNIGGSIGGGVGTIHGGRGDDSRTYADGIDTGWGGGSSGGGNMGGNTVSAQEVVVTTSGGLGEAVTAGVILNVIPRDGSNTYSGSFVFSGANGSMQGSNYTQRLQDAGLKTPSELINVYDVSPMGGGRIIRDKLWFYLTFRQTGGETTVPGMWFNKNAGNPNAWVVDFDKSRPAFSDGTDKNGIGRITYQATPRNKFTASWSEQYNASSTKGGGTSTATPESSGRTLFQPSHIQQATWSSPVTSRILLEAGWGTYQSRYRNPEPRVDGSHNDRMIRLTEQGGDIPNLISRMPAGVGGGFNHHLIGGLAHNHASISYVTGAHNMKFGYQGGFDNPSQEYHYFNEVIAVRTNLGAPNRLTQTIEYPGTAKYVRNLLPTSFYGQDQWTHNRLTLQGGIRYDHLLTTYPESHVGGPGYTASAPIAIVYPSRSTQGVHWDDVTTRWGAAYDLFGNGKTAVKFNIGKYMQAFSATNTDLDLNPLIRTTTSTTRTWTDTNKDFVVNCNLANTAANAECGAMADKTLGTQVFSRSYDPNFVTGFGNRPYNWGLGLSVQQEVLPRVSVNVGYFRNWWGNWYVVHNQATTLADYTPFSIVAPVDARLGSYSGQVVSGLYDLVPGKVGLLDELAQHSSNIGTQIENWQGVDVNVSARLRNGLTVQGGTSTGRKFQDACDVRNKMPELGANANGANNSIAGSTNGLTLLSVTNPYCRVVEPYLTQIRGLATYTIPKAGVQVSGTWASNPGINLAANYVASNAVIAAGPQALGRVLSGGANNVTVNLIPPGTLYGPRRNTLDLRVSKILRYGRTRTQVGVDVYNLANTDYVTSYNQTYSPTTTTWLTPTGVQAARYVRFNAQFDF